MVVEKDKMVSLIYTLRELDIKGNVIEEVDESNPLSFMFGTGQMLHRFEENIENLSGGDKFEFALTPAEAYGEKREDLVVDIPRSVFEVDGNFDDNICKVGNQVPMADSQGRRLLGVVTEIKDDAVAMDFNHPMAGVNLHFTGNILEVRETTEEEKSMLEGNSNGCSTCGSHSSCDGHC
ncbi:MAG: FKBP-type peptidyl-prolyl cis-trans isomerase [Bacteroidales bacterium]|nr:FKBP-type peptidyl-prolyl cis-trans isomerase [Bacteroidales bacterium]